MSVFFLDNTYTLKYANINLTMYDCLLILLILKEGYTISSCIRVHTYKCPLLQNGLTDEIADMAYSFSFTKHH
jgi:hypothetical protein